MARRDQAASSVNDIAPLLHRQFRLADNARFLRRMPAFAADDEMPSKLSELVQQLDKAEGRAER